MLTQLLTFPSSRKKCCCEVEVNKNLTGEHNEDNDKNHFNEDAELVRHLCHEFVHALQNHGDGPMPDQTKHWLKDPAEIDARKREIELAEIVGYWNLTNRKNVLLYNRKEKS